MGGDFYDLFPSGGRGWTVVMGDVCGKGPDAAAVTALARYTLRAAAMRERLPSRGLHVLNEALLRQRSRPPLLHGGLRLPRVRRQRGAGSGFASGGHPLPLLVRPDGAVEPVGAPGTLLGVVPDPSFEDRSVELAPGDALVFYTDGVIEDRGDGGARGGAAGARSWPSAPARARTRSPRAWRKRRSARRAAIPATTSRCSCCAWRTARTPERGCQRFRICACPWTMSTGRQKHSGPERANTGERRIRLQSPHEGRHDALRDAGRSTLHEPLGHPVRRRMTRSASGSAGGTDAAATARGALGAPAGRHRPAADGDAAAAGHRAGDQQREARARSDSVVLRVLVRPSAVWTEVTDEGPGFDPATTGAPRDDRSRLGPVPRRAAGRPLGRQARGRRHQGLVRAAPRLARCAAASSAAAARSVRVAAARRRGRSPPPAACAP